MGDSFRKVRRAQSRKFLQRPSSGVFARDASGDEAECDVFDHRRHENLIVGVLPRHAHSPAGGFSLAVDRNSVDQTGSRIGGEAPGEVQEEGGFPRTVRADECDPVSAVGPEIYAVERASSLRPGIADVPEFDERHSGPPETYSRRIAADSAAAAAASAESFMSHAPGRSPENPFSPPRQSNARRTCSALSALRTRDDPMTQA